MKLFKEQKRMHEAMLGVVEARMVWEDRLILGPRFILPLK